MAARLATAWSVTRSPWVWRPAALTTAGIATATLTLGRMLTAPPQPRRSWVPWSLRVIPAGADRIRLSGPAAAAPGRWGLDFAGGSGIVEEPVAGSAPDLAVRPFTLL